MPVINHYIVSNKKRESGTDNNWVSGQFDFPYGRYFKLRRATFTNSIYNVGPNNCKFTIRRNSDNATTDFEIPNAYYASQSIFVTDLNTLIQATFPNITVTFDAKTYKLSFTSSSGTYKLYFVGDHTAEEVLGFSYVGLADAYTIPVTTSVLTGPYTLDLSYPNQLYLCSKALSSYEGQTKIAGELVDNVIGVLPVDLTFGDVTVENIINTLHNMHPKQNKKIDFQVKDKYGLFVNLNGGDITIEFLISDSLETLWE